MDAPKDSGGADGGPWVLYPVFGSHDTGTFEVARDVAEGAGLSLLVLDLVRDSGEATDEERSVGTAVLANKLDEVHDVDVRTRYEVTDTPVEATVTVARGHDTRLLVFDEHAPEQLVVPFGRDVKQRISDRVPCDAVVVERARNTDPGSILVPVAGGPHSAATVSVAGAFARSTNATVRLFHVTREKATADHYFSRAREHLPDGVAVRTRHVSAPSVADAIVEASTNADATTIGEPTRNRLKRFLFGSVTDDVSEQSSGTVLVCRRSDGGTFSVRT